MKTAIKIFLILSLVLFIFQFIYIIKEIVEIKKMIDYMGPYNDSSVEGIVMPIMGILLIICIVKGIFIVLVLMKVSNMGSGAEMSIGVKVCILIFIDFISGVLLLCWVDYRPNKFNGFYRDKIVKPNKNDTNNVNPININYVPKNSDNELAKKYLSSTYKNIMNSYSKKNSEDDKI